MFVTCVLKISDNILLYEVVKLLNYSLSYNKKTVGSLPALLMKFSQPIPPPKTPLPSLLFKVLIVEKT
jgi:hypothetical protein